MVSKTTFKMTIDKMADVLPDFGCKYLWLLTKMTESTETSVLQLPTLNSRSPNLRPDLICFIVVFEIVQTLVIKGCVLYILNMFAFVFLL